MCIVAARFGNATLLWDFHSDGEDEEVSSGIFMITNVAGMLREEYQPPDRSSYPRCSAEEVLLWKDSSEFRDNFVNACNGDKKTAKSKVYLISIARALFRTYRDRKGTKRCFTCHGEVAVCGRHFCKFPCANNQGSPDCLKCVDQYCTDEFRLCLGVENDSEMPLRALSNKRTPSRNNQVRPPRPPRRKNSPHRKESSEVVDMEQKSDSMPSERDDEIPIPPSLIPSPSTVGVVPNSPRYNEVSGSLEVADLDKNFIEASNGMVERLNDEGAI